MSIYDEISEQKLDALKELGNIGAGNAATAISTMLNKKIDITVPSTEIIPISELWKEFSDPEDVTTGSMVEIGGELHGAILFLLGTQETKKILELLMLPRPEDLTQIDEMTSSAIGEVGNIMCSSYISAISNFTGLNIHSLPPKITVDMLTAIVSESSLMVTEGSDFVILIRTDISIEEYEGNVKGFLIYLSDEKNIIKLLKTLGMGTNND
ncbi:CheY-P phosphatase CheC [Petrotoga halophila]|uniref:CheC-like protein domain-containing protein n=1 Tax=Petrotoga halophila DSM 16923 TaxID=1122953 RepID=A0A2S5EG78_9BACT|nr:CheY-P phosphatase CheC [Petrotoga halophila]MDN5346393.1 chemotaxis protein CheC [Petrotoga sp.]POZ92146.1 hypothetical protein AA81_08660 [Petrotoga halophila DSM 16923]